MRLDSSTSLSVGKSKPASKALAYPRPQDSTGCEQTDSPMKRSIPIPRQRHREDSPRQRCAPCPAKHKRPLFAPTPAVTTPPAPTEGRSSAHLKTESPFFILKLINPIGWSKTHPSIVEHRKPIEIRRIVQGSNHSDNREALLL